MSRKKHKLWAGILFAVFAFLAVWLAASVLWTFTNWYELTIEEIVFQLTAPLTGTGNNMVNKYLLNCVLPPTIVFILVMTAEYFLHKKKYFLVVVRIGVGLAAVLTIGTFAYIWQKLDVGNFVANYGRESTYIEDNYVSPDDVDLEFPKEKRNLIYIYLESMETTFADEANNGASPENYIPELTQLAEENEDFSGSDTKLNGARSLTASTWTVAAMFGQTSGLPLKIALDTNGMSTQNVFFPGITTIGDVLQKEGYRQVLMMGSKVSFGGRELYFREHGNYEMRDLNWARETGRVPRDYYVWWGLEDYKLMTYAKQTLSELGRGTQPFNFTMLTVDTHFPDGYLCPLCDTTEFGGDQYPEVMHCSSRQIAELIEWCKEQPWYDNTTIVISGDHPTMDAKFGKKVQKGYTRRVYTCYINSAVETKDPERTRDYSTLDAFPTTLAAMGVKIPGEKLGLGTNLFSDVDTLVERDGATEVNTQFMRTSKFMSEASGISQHAVELRKNISKMKAKVKVHVDAQQRIHFSITGLEDLDQYDADVNYVYVHLRNSNMLNLASYRTIREADGSYTAILDGNKIAYDDILYMIRISTKEGTIDMTEEVPYSIR